MIGSHGKLNEEKAEIIKSLLNTGEYTHQQIADFFGVSRPMITKINAGTRWNEPTRSFEMREPKPIRSNDFRDFGDKELLTSKVELFEDEKSALTMEERYFMIKFIESLTGRRIKKMIVQM